MKTVKKAYKAYNHHICHISLFVGIRRFEKASKNSTLKRSLNQL